MARAVLTGEARRCWIASREFYDRGQLAEIAADMEWAARREARARGCLPCSGAFEEVLREVRGRYVSGVYAFAVARLVMFPNHAVPVQRGSADPRAHGDPLVSVVPVAPLSGMSYGT